MVAGQRQINSSELPSPTEILRGVFGFEGFRDQQAEIVERTLAGKHSLVVMPTGGGKSLCFQVPALVWAQQGSGQKPGQGRPLTIVLSPLIGNYTINKIVDRLGKPSILALFLAGVIILCTLIVLATSVFKIMEG